HLRRWNIGGGSAPCHRGEAGSRQQGLRRVLRAAGRGASLAPSRERTGPHRSDAGRAFPTRSRADPARDSRGAADFRRCAGAAGPRAPTRAARPALSGTFARRPCWFHEAMPAIRRIPMGELKDKAKGIGNEIAGEAKQASSDPSTRAEGQAQERKGEAQNLKGKIKGALGNKV